MDLHSQLVKKALPFIFSYKDDLLIHDKRQLAEYPDRPFLHFTGSTGTHIVTLYFIDDYPPKGEQVPYLFGTADRNHMLAAAGSETENMTRWNRMDLILYFNGKTLKAIDHSTAVKTVDDYIAKMKIQFNS